MSSLLHPRRFHVLSRAFSIWLHAVAVGLAAFALAGFAPPPAASAMTVVPRDFEALVARAETIFKGTVTNQESLWTGEGQNRAIVTRVTFQVSETYKGAAASTQTLEFLGGTVDGQTLRVPDMPRFTLGETAVLFVVGNGVQACPLVGAFQGRFHVRTDAASARDRIYAHDGHPVTDTARIGTAETTAPTASTETPLLAETFRERIIEKLRERRARNLPEVARDEN